MREPRRGSRARLLRSQAMREPDRKSLTDCLPPEGSQAGRQSGAASEESEE